jgi:hypothetical protein
MIDITTSLTIAKMSFLCEKFLIPALELILIHDCKTLKIPILSK